MATPTLRHFDPDTFLRDYWQQQPLVIRNALPADAFPLSPEELAGLACEEAVESRLITVDARQHYTLRHGPFPESTFPALPVRDWTLLVQAVDHYRPEVTRLLDAFDFIPGWRIDDIMVSYAPPGGSAGPHYDHYDVFLIQGAGRRLWQIGPAVTDDPPLAEHSDLRLLRDFQPQQEWELGPGDILYLPPRIAHWGISTSTDCMTYSVGFRSPSAAELLSEFCDRAIAELDEHQRYTDPDLTRPAGPGEITPAVIDRVHDLATRILGDRDRIARWFGQFITEPKYPIHEPGNEGPEATPALGTLLANGCDLYRDPTSRFAWLDRGEILYLCVDGEEYPLDTGQRDVVETLCAQRRFSAGVIADYMTRPAVEPVLLALYTQGHLYWDDALYGPDGTVE